MPKDLVANPAQTEKQSTDKPLSPLAKHIAFFSNMPNATCPVAHTAQSTSPEVEHSNVEQLVSYESMCEQQEAVGISKEEAASTASTVSFIAGLFINWWPWTTFKPEQAVGTLNHARDTGLYNTDGTVNEERWAELCTYSEEFNGEPIITKKRMYEFIGVVQARDNRSDFMSFGKTASDGEWRTFFQLFTNVNKPTKDGIIETGVTLKRLRSFLDDSRILFGELAEQRLARL